MNLRNPFKALMDEQTESQRQIAKSLGIPSPVLNRYITGSRVPNYPTAERICDAMDATPDERKAVMEYLKQATEKRIERILAGFNRT